MFLNWPQLRCGWEMEKRGQLCLCSLIPIPTEAGISIPILQMREHAQGGKVIFPQS